MLPEIMIAVTFATNPAATSAWPWSERDAALEATESVLRDRMTACVTEIKHIKEQRRKYGEYLNAIGGGTDHERKLLSVYVRRTEEWQTELETTRNQMKTTQSLREAGRPLRVELPKPDSK